MSGKIKRVPKNYDGKYPTGRQLKELLPRVLDHISDQFDNKKDLVFQEWDKIIGPKFSPMAVAKDFKNNVLFVSVKNSSLYSILKSQQKDVLLKKLRESLPHVDIENIVFHIGS